MLVAHLYTLLAAIRRNYSGLAGHYGRKRKLNFVMAGWLAVWERTLRDKVCLPLLTVMASWALASSWIDLIVDPMWMAESLDHSLNLSPF